MKGWIRWRKPHIRGRRLQQLAIQPQQQKVFYFAFYGLVCTGHWNVSACLGSRSGSCWSNATLVVPKCLLVVVLKKIASWGLRFGVNVYAQWFCYRLYFQCAPNFFICDGPNASFIENCEDPESWHKLLSRAKRDFPTAKGPDKLDLNYEFPKDVAGRNFQIVIFNVNSIQWRSNATEMAGVLSWKNRIFCFCCKLFSNVNVALSTQWCRSWRCKRNPKSFDFSKIRAEFLKIRAQKFRHLCSYWVIHEFDWIK